MQIDILGIIKIKIRAFSNDYEYISCQAICDENCYNRFDITCEHNCYNCNRRCEIEYLQGKTVVLLAKIIAKYAFLKIIVLTIHIVLC